MQIATYPGDGHPEPMNPIAFIDAVDAARRAVRGAGPPERTTRPDGPRRPTDRRRAHRRA
jgi:hypothetical protein